MNPILQKLYEVDLTGVQQNFQTRCNNTYVVVVEDFRPEIVFKAHDETEWKIIPLFDQPYQNVSCYIAGFDGNLLLLHLAVNGAFYLKLVDISTQQVHDLNIHPIPMIVGFKDRKVFLAEILSIETVNIKQFFIDDSRTEDIATVNQSFVSSLKVLVSFNHDLLLYSNKGNYYSIISLAEENNVYFH